MKYSYMLLITLVVSLIWGLLLFVLGCVVRFQQAMLLNNFLQGLDSEINPAVCEKKDGSMTINLCPLKTSFDSIELGDWANSFGSIIIITGFLIIVLSACGFLGVMKKSQILLLLMLVLIIVAIGLEYYIIDVVLANHGSFHTNAKEELIERIAAEYSVTNPSPTEFTRMLNAVQLQAECCGISGPEDFHLNETIMLNGEEKTIRVPPSCCEREDFTQDSNEEGFTRLIQCAEDSWSIRSVQTGCYSVIHKSIYEKYGGGLVGFLMFLILWEGVQGILLFMIILKPAPRTPKKSITSSVGSGRGPTAVTADVSKKFIPYSKVSSFVSSDINRIKSTEIW